MKNYIKNFMWSLPKSIPWAYAPPTRRHADKRKFDNVSN